MTRTTRTLCIAAALAGALSLGGCAHGPTRNQVGIGTGAVVGGVVGNALIGGPLATVGGAAAGALVGNELTRGRR
ncbi:MAG: glycine zipper 2TM domain-containing protein [Acidovorax sp.]